MKRCGAFCCFSLLITAVPLLAQEASPDTGSFEVEPPLLVQPDGKSVAQSEASPTQAADVAGLEKKLERAKASAASAERLWKIGVLAKVEAEQRALRVVRLQAELTKAQVAELQKSAAVMGDGIVQTGQAALSNRPESKILLAQAVAAAQTATTNLNQAELEAATRNLQRQKKLRALGSARKCDVTRAEEKLAAIKRNSQ